MPRTSLSSASTRPKGAPSTSRWSQPSDGQGCGPGAAEQARQPAGQVAADHVAVLGVSRPAADQLSEDRRAPGERALQCVFEVEQAQIILAALADDDLALALLRVGEQFRAFAVELAQDRHPQGPRELSVDRKSTRLNSSHANIS